MTDSNSVNGTSYDYDLIAIGSGPGGQRAAIQAAKLGKRVALIERKVDIGGVCVRTGTIPSKTLREATVALSGYRDRGFLGASHANGHNIGMEELVFRTDQVVRNEVDVVRDQLQRNGVDLYDGTASFIDSHTLAVDDRDGHQRQTLTARHIVIATGTTATRDEHIPFDRKRVITSDDAITMDRLPRTMAVIGAGVIGLEYASMFAALGTRVTLIDKRPRLLPFIDSEVMDALAFHMRERRMTLWLGEEVSGVELDEGDDGKVRIHLVSGKHIVAEKALYSIGRSGATRRLNLPAAGLAPDDRGRLVVDEQYRTVVPHIYAVGDVIGFPSLASTSLEQGRLAACHAFGIAARSVPSLVPYAVYTIPEISAVGRTEEDLTRDGIPYEVGKAQYKEIARGQIIGDRTGLLKLIFHWETHELLGVHIIGEGASELIHIGQAVMTFGGTVRALRRDRLQLPDAGRVLQDGRARRAQPARLLADGRPRGRRHPHGRVAPPPPVRASASRLVGDARGRRHRGVLQQARPGGVGDLDRCAPSGNRHAVGPRELGDLAGNGAKGLLALGAEHHQIGLEAPRGVAQRVDRRVGSEIGDPPSVLAQADAEAEQTEIVLLAGGAGEQCARSAAHVEAAREAEQASAQQGAGEVLLGHGERAVLPAVADAAHVREHNVAQHHLHAEGGEQAVEDALGLDVAEGLERRAELGTAARERGVAIVDRGRRRGVEHHARGDRRRVALGQVAPHRPDPLVVPGAVEAEAPVRALGRQQAVAALPHAQQVGCHPVAPGELPDAQEGGGTDRLAGQR